MLQRERDQRAGLNTAGFISGYRGSPLGGLDQALWSAQEAPRARTTSSSSPASTRTSPRPRSGARSRSTCSRARSTTACSRMWYGKGPGVDRCGDVFKHANAAGTSKHGGVLVLAGDDHAAKSSTLPHQTRAHLQGLPDPGARTRRTCRTTSTSACTAARCAATRAAGSGSSASPTSVESGASVDRRSGPRADR